MAVSYSPQEKKRRKSCQTGDKRGLEKRMTGSEMKHKRIVLGKENHCMRLFLIITFYQSENKTDFMVKEMCTL